MILIGIPIGATCSESDFKIFAITVGLKKHKPITKKKKHDKIAFLVKTFLEVLISKALIDSNISYDKFVLVNTVLKEYDDMKKEINNLKILWAN